MSPVITTPIAATAVFGALIPRPLMIAMRYAALLLLLPTAPAMAADPTLPRLSRPVPTRQVHLDFHTSRQLENIGEEFSKEQWQDALRVGHVNGINIFAKGHHSWSYYPTKVGRQHPNLKFDLLGAQVEACHEIGVECPFYFTVGWSVNDAADHPEWCVRNKDGSFRGGPDPEAKPTDPIPFGTWRLLCPSGEYHDLIMRQVDELCQLYDVDGFWFDIYQARHDGCYCDNCRARMKRKGIDVDDDKAVLVHFVDVYKEHMRELRELIATHHPEASVFFNGTTSFWSNSNQNYGTYECNTHQDLEDLPTGWGGYDKFPLKANFFHDLGYQVCAMSGKFHTSWGEFGGFKHPNGLKYEAAAMVAFGAACNFGDQLHPSGVMDPQTYRNLGEAFSYVEQIEEYGVGGTPVADLGLWFTGHSQSDQAVAKLLMEKQRVFRVANPRNIDSFRTIVVPSHPSLDETDVAAIEAFLEGGGKLLVLGEGAMNDAGDGFVLDVGAEYVGEAHYDSDYTRVSDELASQGLMTSPVLNYVPAMRVKPDDDALVLAQIYEPFFSRTHAHYTSHRNTPQQPQPAEHPAVIQKGNVMFSPSPLDRIYADRAAPPHRDLFDVALGRLHENPVLSVDLPSSGRVNLLHQPEQKRYVAHVLYATPHYRGGLELIEDIVPLRDVALSVRLPVDATSATLIPDGQPLEIAKENGVCRVTVPEFSMHAAVVFGY